MRRSFSKEVKIELCRAGLGERPAAIAECYGIMLFCNTFLPDEVRIVTTCQDFALRVPRLLWRAFGVELDGGIQEAKAGKRILTLRDGRSLERIFDAYGMDRRGHISHHVNLALLEDEDTRESFLRGAFLAGGSVVDPEKGYHLEFVTDHYMVNREITALFMDMGFEPGSVSRGGTYITYFKPSSVIEDLLTTMGAPVSAMRIMSAKVEKDMTNLVNRKVNCDTANVAKTVEASALQLAAIKKLRETGAMKGLSDKMQYTARLREENPELALSELAAVAEPPVSKSGLSHRLKRLVEIADL